MITRKFGPKEMKVFERLAENYGQIVQNITQDPQTGDVVYKFSEPSHQMSTFETETGVPVALTRRIKYDLAEEILSSVNTKKIGSAIRKYLIDDFAQWARYQGVDVKGEPENLLITLNRAALQRSLQTAKDDILAEVKEMRRMYRMSNSPSIDAGYAQIAYAVLETDDMGLKIELHPYTNVDNDSKTDKLDELFSEKELKIVRELTGVEETENLRRQILDKIREGQIIVDEDAVRKMLEQPHLPEELRMLYSGLETDGPNKLRVKFTDGVFSIGKVKP